MITPNTMVIITDINGDAHEVEALSGIEKGRDMPIVWVNLPKKSGDFEPFPWPAEFVKAKEEQ